MKIKNKTFVKYLLSYILILIIPIIFINAIFSGRFIKLFKTETLSNVNADLSQLISELDNEMRTIANTVTQISLSSEIINFNFSNDTLGAQAIIKKMAAYSNTNNFIHDVFIHYNNSDYLVSSTTTCTIDVFLNSLYYYDGIDYDEFTSMLFAREKPRILHSERSQENSVNDEYITVIYPIFTDYKTGNCSVIFQIRNATISKMMQSKLDKYSASTYILNDEKSIIASSNSLPDITSENLLGMIKSQPKDQLVTINNEKYLLMPLSSEQMQWEYISLIPIDQEVFSNLNSITAELYAITLLVLAIASVVIAFVMNLTYNPIKKLKEKASTLNPTTANNSELELIGNTLDFLTDQNNYLSSRFEENRSSIKNTKLQELLMGQFSSVTEFNEKCYDVHLNFSRNQFFVATLLFHATHEITDELARFIQTYLNKRFECKYLFTFEQNKIILINCIDECDINIIETQFTSMQSELLYTLNCTVSIGVGTIAKDILSIPKSYLDSVSALNYRFVKGNGSIIFFHEIYNDYTTQSTYPIDDFERLKNSVRLDDDESITKNVDSIIQFIQDKKLPLFVARGICFDVVRLFTSNIKNNIFWADQNIDIFKLSDVDTAYDIIAIIKNLRDSIFTSNNLQDVDGTLIEQIIEFINENCLLCNFSIQETSEHFNMLLPNLSQFFKEKTGQNILDYSTNIRMNKAKVLLSTTQIPLKELGYQIGYYNVSSFIRRFKQTQGITPGDYRKLYSPSVN